MQNKGENGGKEYGDAIMVLEREEQIPNLSYVRLNKGNTGQPIGENEKIFITNGMRDTDTSVINAELIHPDLMKREATNEKACTDNQFWIETVKIQVTTGFIRKRKQNPPIENRLTIIGSMKKQ